MRPSQLVAAHRAPLAGYLLTAACGTAVISTVACGAASVPVTQPDPTPNEPPPVEYPATERQDTEDTLHGVTVADPYRWLEDASSPRVQQWVQAQDAYAREALNALPERDALKARFEQLLYLDAVSTPIHRSGRYFYTRRHKDREKSIIYVREGLEGEERPLIDPNGMSEDGSVSVGRWNPSRDGKFVVYQRKENNADEATLHVRDVTTGEDSKVDVIPGAKYAGPTWMPDTTGFFYEWLPTDPNLSVADRPGYTELRYHKLGEDPAKDMVVIPALLDPKVFLGGEVSRDGRFLVLYADHGWNSTDVYIRDLQAHPLSDKDGGVDPASLKSASFGERLDKVAGSRHFARLAAGLDATFRLQWFKDAFFALTNLDAPNYRVLRIEPDKLAREQWQEVVPQSEATIERARVVGGHLALTVLRNASSELQVRKLDGTLVRKSPLPGIGTSDGLVGEADRDEAYFDFTSFTVPGQVYRTSVAEGGSALWAEVKLPVDTSGLEVKQVWYPSSDGTRISMFIVHRRDLDRSKPTHTLLYGYGGFNISLTPAFSSAAVTWVERGGVYAVPNLRGGGEYGEEWHRAGMLLKKQNVFDDFIAAAEYLISEGYASKEQLAIWGGSNGGLLVGATMTQRPDLLGAVVCSAPLLDMVRYHLFGSGKTWIAEYGSADDPEQFGVLHAYSPYHHVTGDRPYPALLMLTPDSDDRVDPLHARKFTAAVQHASKDPARPVWMRVETNAGHGGGDMVVKRVDKYADTLAFLLKQLQR